MGQRQKRNTSDRAQKSPEICGCELARPELRTATFSKCVRDEWVDLLLPSRRTCSERQGHDFTGHLQSLDTSFSTDHPGGAHFRSAHRPFCQPNSDRASAHIFCRGALVSVDWPWLTGNGKKRKSFVPGQLWHGRRCGYWSDPGRRNGLLPGISVAPIAIFWVQI